MTGDSPGDRSPTPDDVDASPDADGDPSPDADGGQVAAPDDDGDDDRIGERGGAVLTTGDTTVIARTSARVVVPIILMTSLSLLFQGHILPGGGFIGGVLTAIAFALVYIVFGLDYVRNSLLGVPATRVEVADPEERSGSYRMTFAVGLGLAAGSGLVPVFLGFPFLTQGVAFVEHLPLYGDFEVASAFAFDLGVYLVVVGGLLTILREVGEE